MEQEKPFKTIEVLDSRTRQLCKVACMSCIRGHRTTSCGIPVCRSKVFWTVKRPGRPSNSCTCRYGATGGCKCVVTKSACPHKAKKGEKRSGECRCDEQGRYCCLLEPEHWTALHALRKPTVDFFQTRELLESHQSVSNQTPVSQPLAYPISSPPSTISVPNTPNNGYGSFQSMQSSTLTPRFGMMGVDDPQGSHSHPSDLLAWKGQSAPREIVLPPMFEPAESEPSSCCQQSIPRAQIMHSPLEGRHLSFSQSHSPQEMSLSQPYNGINGTHAPAGLPPTLSSPSLPPVYEPPAFDFGRMQAQYYANQFPNAICQNCGLSGCTCRNCPPIFQNPFNTSWAQCCGRKHAMDVQPNASIPTKIARTATYTGEGLRAYSSAISAPFVPQSAEAAYQAHALFAIGQHDEASFHNDLNLRPPDDSHSAFEAFDLDHQLFMPDAGQHLDMSEFLLSDLDRSNQENGGGGPGGTAGGIDGGDDDGGGGGGCCCR